MTSVTLFLLLSQLSFLAGFAQPVQLVKPSPDHKTLQIVDDGIAYLHSIKGPVGVISAVGAIHSGKSFLLNQLAGGSDEQSGFRVGYTVLPETSGIWMSEVRAVGNDDTRILLLDTEGLFSPDATDAYDARLFAITTLLSSEVIYNTVKFIDSQHVDALETLIRRTSLFGLRAYAQGNPDSDDGTSNLSSFLKVLVPSKLSWVVQDFVQDLEHRQPEEWLRQLLNRDDDHPQDTIGSFFSHIDCVPLPLPIGDQEHLMKLDKVSSDKLTHEYRSAIKSFRDRLVRRAISYPKQKSGAHSVTTAMTGKDLADLLTFLVSASNIHPTSSNGNPFPILPSIAEQFTSLQLKLMKDDILEILKKDVTATAQAALDRGRPLSRQSFKEEAQRAKGNAEDLWSASIKGLTSHKASQDEVERAFTDFKSGLASVEETAWDQHCSDVREWCEGFVDKLTGSFKDRLNEYLGSGPPHPDNLVRKIPAFQSPIIAEYLSAVGVGAHSSECCNSTKDSFERRLETIGEAAVDKNDKVISAQFNDVVNLLVGALKQRLDTEKSDLMNSPRTTIDNTLAIYKKETTVDFETKMERFRTVTMFAIKRSELLSQVDLLAKGISNEWNRQCAINAGKFLDTHSSRYKMRVSRNIPLPAEDDYLSRTLHVEADQLRADYRRAVICHDTPEGSQYTLKLEELIQGVSEDMVNQNSRTLLRVSGTQLDNLRSDLNSEVVNWNNPHAFKLHARERALKALHDSHSSTSDTVDMRATTKGLERAADMFVRDRLHGAVKKIWGCFVATIIGVLLTISLIYRAIQVRKIWGNWWGFLSFDAAALCAAVFWTCRKSVFADFIAAISYPGMAILLGLSVMLALWTSSQIPQRTIASPATHADLQWSKFNNNTPYVGSARNSQGRVRTSYNQ